uniref:Uncharacterized protein n=1 Tax=Octopus bimaculoides TaxID=37653 RepID=A0A0L8GFJ8_OCTBM
MHFSAAFTTCSKRSSWQRREWLTTALLWRSTWSQLFDCSLPFTILVQLYQ